MAKRFAGSFFAIASTETRRETDQTGLKLTRNLAIRLCYITETGGQTENWNVEEEETDIVKSTLFDDSSL